MNINWLDIDFKLINDRNHILVYKMVLLSGGNLSFHCTMLFCTLLRSATPLCNIHVVVDLINSFGWQVANNWLAEWMWLIVLLHDNIFEYDYCVKGWRKNFSLAVCSGSGLHFGAQF